MTNEKTKVGSFLQKAAKVVRFGVVEGIKGGTPFGFVLNTIEKATGKDLATGDVKDVKWEKIILKALGFAAVILLWKMGAIDIEFIKGIIENLLKGIL